MRLKQFLEDFSTDPDLDDEFQRRLDKHNQRQKNVKEHAFKELGLDQHQWDVFSMTWDYCEEHFK